MKLSRTTLLQLLIGKSVAEAVIVAAVAAAFYITTINPNLQGWLDQADTQTVSGWAVDRENPGRRVEVQLFIDDKFVEQRPAADFRPDVHQANRADDDWHGFVFRTPALALGKHEARVYVLHRSAVPARRTLQMIGQPLRFEVASSPMANVRGGKR